jgi:hypothetical protein
VVSSFHRIRQGEKQNLLAGENEIDSGRHCKGGRGGLAYVNPELSVHVLPNCHVVSAVGIEGVAAVCLFSVPHKPVVTLDAVEIVNNHDLLATGKGACEALHLTYDCPFQINPLRHLLEKICAESAVARERLSWAI